MGTERHFPGGEPDLLKRQKWSARFRRFPEVRAGPPSPDKADRHTSTKNRQWTIRISIFRSAVSARQTLWIGGIAALHRAEESSFRSWKRQTRKCSPKRVPISWD